MAINNCATCDHFTKHKQTRGEDYCYMFAEEPKTVCYQHTATKVRTVFIPSPIGAIPVPSQVSPQVHHKVDTALLRVQLANASQLMGSRDLAVLCHEAYARIKQLEAAITKNEAPKPPPLSERATVDMVVTPQNMTPPNDGLPDLDYRGIWAQCLKIASEDMRTLCAPPLGPAEKRRYKNQLNERALKEFGLRVIL